MNLFNGLVFFSKTLAFLNDLYFMLRIVFVESERSVLVTYTIKLTNIFVMVFSTNDF